jgi:hypothetical protein
VSNFSILFHSGAWLKEALHAPENRRSDFAGKNVLCSGLMGRDRWTEERETKREKTNGRKDIDH